MKKLLFLVNVDYAFASHRLPIALRAQHLGYDVHVATLITDKKEELERHGLMVHPLPMKRGMAGLFSEIKNFFEILSVFRKVKPDVVHLVTAKSIIFGGIAARLFATTGVVAAVPGLGSMFIGQGLKSKITKSLISQLFKFVLNGKNTKVIFQNPDDRDQIVKLTGLRQDQIEMIRGSGTDLRHYQYSPISPGRPVVVLASRLLGDKGVREFCEAAKQLKEANIDAEFLLAGNTDPSNPSSIPEQELLDYQQAKIINWVGHTDDIPSLFQRAHIVVLPSYREGLPKVLIEAAACGRPVITTDVPGCRDAIMPDVTGLLVPVKSVTPLADAIRKLIENPELCIQMGRAGRAFAEQTFDINQVVETHLKIYEKCLSFSTATEALNLHKN